MSISIYCSKIYLTHWGRVTHKCISKLANIGSDDCLSHGRRRAIIWANAKILLIRRLGTDFSGILSEIHKFSRKKMHLNMSSGKWRPFCLGLNVLMARFHYSLTHSGRVTHICVGKQTIIGSNNGLSPERRQALIWTNAGILWIGPLGTNFSEILIEIQTLSWKKIRLKMSSAKCCLFRLVLNVLILPWIDRRRYLWYF